MTYRQLLDQLGKLSPDQLDNMDVAVFVHGEFYSVEYLDVITEESTYSDVLDNGHPVLWTV